jgi:predicted DNA-binding transcriptional regulator AlpA
MNQSNTFANKRKLLSVSEVAEWLGVSAAWVRDHAQGRREPKLVGVKLGAEDGKGLWKFLESDVEQFIQSCRQE